MKGFKQGSDMLRFQVQKKKKTQHSGSESTDDDMRALLKRGHIINRSFFSTSFLIKSLFSFFCSPLRKGLFCVLSHQCVLILSLNQQEKKSFRGKILIRNKSKISQKQVFSLSKLPGHFHRGRPTSPCVHLREWREYVSKASSLAVAHSNLKLGPPRVSQTSRMLKRSYETKKTELWGESHALSLLLLGKDKPLSSSATAKPQGSA